jgi:ATP-dependent Clp protease protease subunit
METISKYSDSIVELTKSRTIILSETFTSEMSSALSSLLIYYDHINQEEPIKIHINSNGGEIASLLNIYDVMHMISAPVKTICMGRAYSAGAFLLASGKKGHRYALKNSKIMLHGIQCGFPLESQDLKNNKNYYEFLTRYNDLLFTILTKHTGQTFEKIKEDCKSDLYLSADEALKYGVIDNVISSFDEIK